MENKFEGLDCIEGLSPEILEKHLKEHLSYLNRKFTITCYNIFDKDECEILLTVGSWLEALANEKITPFTYTQLQFVEVSKRKRNPETEYEIVWVKYCKRLEWESVHGRKWVDKREAAYINGIWTLIPSQK